MFQTTKPVVPCQFHVAKVPVIFVQERPERQHDWKAQVNHAGHSANPGENGTRRLTWHCMAQLVTTEILHSCIVWILCLIIVS